MIKTLIVDDEKPALEELAFLLKKYSDIEVCAMAADGKEALSLFSQDRDDLVFLDIQMPEMNGIELAHELLNTEKPPHIIFVTAFDCYAIEAFEVHALDYLLKPVESDRLDAAVQEARNHIQNNQSQSISIHDLQEMFQARESLSSGFLTVCQDERFVPLQFSEIKFLYVVDKKTHIFTEKGRYVHRAPLGQIEKNLPDYFIRTHRAYIINTRYISEVHPWFNGAFQILVKHEEEQVPLSRAYAHHFKRFIGME